jgi:hypothetical protein
MAGLTTAIVHKPPLVRQLITRLPFAGLVHYIPDLTACPAMLQAALPTLYKCATEVDKRDLHQFWKGLEEILDALAPSNTRHS